MNPPKLPPIYYSKPTSKYWFRAPDKPLLELDGRSIKLQIMRLGMPLDAENPDTGLKLGDKILVDSMNNNAVDFAGPLAGHKIGLIKTADGRRVLVTTESKPIAPSETEKPFPKLVEYFEQLFGSEQTLYAMYWLKLAIESLSRGDFRPGQLLVLAGPSGCGKSLFQKIVTALLGGRSAKPYRYMTGGTQFNADLCGAEHLTIEDESAKMDIRSRREFGASIKDFTVNEQTSIHGKGRDATLTMALYKRCTISVNDEPENLMILPPLDPSLLDKITILKCSPATFWTDDRKEIMASLTEELPALVYWLKRLKIRPAMKDNRFGVKAWQHPDILEILTSISPENRMLDFIDAICFAKDDEWNGSASELEQLLLASPGFAWQVQKLLHFSSACGTFLARLQQKYPGRFASRKNAGKSVWTIKKGEA